MFKELYVSKRNIVIKLIKTTQEKTSKVNMIIGNMFCVFILTLIFAVNINGQGQLIFLSRIELFSVEKLLTKVRRLYLCLRISQFFIQKCYARCEFQINQTN